MSHEENNYVCVGPWGGQGGFRWDDGVYGSIRQIIINHAAGIDSIQIEYDRKRCSVWSDKHGGTGGIRIDKVKLDYPEEFLVSISGCYGSVTQWGPVLVRSLTFQSNRKTYGPFGIQDGTHFSCPITRCKVVGFHGRCSWYLDSIGVYLKPLPEQYPSNIALVPSQSVIADGVSENGAYIINQGNSGRSYELVLSVREKEDKKGLSDRFSKHTPSSLILSQEDPKEKQVGFIGYKEKGTSSVTLAVSLGPWGGHGGSIFDDGVHTGVREIHLTRNGGVTSIRVLYDRNGQPIWGNKNGGSTGVRFDKIFFDYPSEILTHISGYYGSTIFMGLTVVRSLTFHTTRQKYGPFGEEQGIPFNSGSTEGMIVGFYGRKGLFIDSIGVHVIEGKPSARLLVDPSNKNDMRITEVMKPGMIKEPTPFGAGPWGGDGGKPWDDGVNSGVKQIYLTKGEAISSIQVEYDKNGQLVWSARHGGAGEGCKIKLDYPSEVLTGISGYYGPINGDEGTQVIRSLTFHTNRGKCGPYGNEVGTSFTSTMTEGKVVGFHGRSGCYLHAIGVHMQSDGVERSAGSQSYMGSVKSMINKLKWL